MKSYLILISLVLLTLFECPSLSFGEEPIEALQRGVDSGIRILKDSGNKAPLPQESAYQNLFEITQTLFDFEEFSKLVLASFWNTFTPQQRVEFVGVFSDFLAKYYLSKLQERYRDEKVNYLNQEIINVRPDLTTLGKIIGGGLPVGAYGGKREIMEKIAPLGPVYQAGTLSGNPLAVAAGLATLRALAKPGVYAKLGAMAKTMAQGLRAAAAATGVPLCVNRVGSMFTAFFSEREVADFPSAAASDMNAYGEYFRGMLERGVYLPPSGYEANFVCLAHKQADIAKTLKAAERVMDDMGKRRGREHSLKGKG